MFSHAVRQHSDLGIFLTAGCTWWCACSQVTLDTHSC